MKTLIAKGRSFLRSELTSLESYILLNIYDSVWKEHLLAMDHLKGSIGLRGYAEKDPKIEYKREGTQMFHQMIETIRKQVTDLILKVQISGSLQARSVWENQQAQHSEAGSFSEQDREAAMQQQGEAQVVKTIKRDKPKVKTKRPMPLRLRQKIQKMLRKKPRLIQITHRTMPGGIIIFIRAKRANYSLCTIPEDGSNIESIMPNPAILLVLNQRSMTIPKSG